MKNFAFVLLSLSLIACSIYGRPSNRASTKVPEVDKTIARLSLEERVGQLFLLGFVGTSFSDGLSKKIVDYRPGGILVFGRNIRSAKQISELLWSAQSTSLKVNRLPLLVAVDQEGGEVTRIKTFPPMPSALAMAKSRRQDLVEDVGFLSGRLMKTLGFNMNLAPVVDLADPTVPSFIGTRSFGEEPEIVASLTGAFSMGLERAGVIATAKHFPGHGPLMLDSHKVTPTSSESLKSLLKGGLVPYLHFSRNDETKAIMLAHVAYPLIDPSGLPATFSKTLVTSILRERMGFSGIVLTDDLEMTGAQYFSKVGERAIRAIEAGADMVMYAWNPKAQKEAFDAVVGAVRNGRISDERINRSLRRILNAKRSIHGLSNTKRPSKKRLRAALNDPQFARIADKIFNTNLQTAFVGAVGVRKKISQKGPLIVVSASKRFCHSFSFRLKSSRVRQFVLKDPKTYDRLIPFLSRSPYSTIIFHVTGAKTAKRLNTLPLSILKRVVVVNTRVSGEVRRRKHLLAVFDLYTRHPHSGLLIAEKIIPSMFRKRSQLEDLSSKAVATKDFDENTDMRTVDFDSM
jgi:beta-N-acetylhexosaminidase